MSEFLRVYKDSVRANGWNGDVADAVKCWHVTLHRDDFPAL
jgi:hypothetical protein